MTENVPYRPISCDFHDIMEATATLRSVARIVFVDADDVVHQRDARILDLATRADGEYMTLDSGESIRFDRIVSIDGARRVDFD